jgi:hypothetical protein
MEVALASQGLAACRGRAVVRRGRRADDVDPDIDELGRSRPVVGVLGDEEGFAEETGRPQLGRCVPCRCAGPLEPGDALAQLALRPPEHVEAGREPERGYRIDREEAFERDAGVVLDAPEHLEVWPSGAGERRPALDEPDPAGRSGRGDHGSSRAHRRGELFDRVLTDRFEQLVAAAVVLSQDERLLDQAGRQIRDLRRVWPSLAQISRRSRRDRSHRRTLPSAAAGDARPRRAGRRSTRPWLGATDAPRQHAEWPAGAGRTDRRGSGRCLQDRDRPPSPRRVRWRAGGRRRDDRSPRRARSRGRCRAMRAFAGQHAPGTDGPRARASARKRHDPPSSGPSRCARSSTTHSGSRLVARTWRRGSRAVRSSTRSATADSTCSQLSSTSKTSRSVSQPQALPRSTAPPTAACPPEQPPRLR